MAIDLADCQFTGPALPEPFVRFELENELTKLKLLAKTTGADGKQLKADWEVYRRHLAQLAVRGGPVRVRNHAVEPIIQRLGYAGLKQQDPVETREGRESGGYILTNDDDSAQLRVWVTSLDEDLDAPAKRGQAYRYSHLRIAQRVLLACGERVGLLTNGVELRLLISDPARPDSQVIIPVDPGWKRSRDVPDSFRFLLALGSPDGVKAVPDLVDKARLQQARVTKDLRDQARKAVRRFVQEVLDHPENRAWLEQQADLDALARDLWHEGLVTIYRLLFVLKAESMDDPARTFQFASSSPWRNTYSPSTALARFAHPVLEQGVETGRILEDGVRSLFRMLAEGLECTELPVRPLGGALFGAAATPVLDKLQWGERAVAHLLDQLLWTTPKRKKGARERVHYGPLDVEDLGRVYEALLELEPGITSEPMCRLRRQKLEVVVPVAQGQKYRPAKPSSDGDDYEESDEEEDEDETPKRGKKTTVQWIEEIPPGRFYLRVGLGRKASGSYYTPHSFVRFLVQETLGPQVAERSPQDDPKPCEILGLKVLDPAMGSGHFLVEACRFLGHHLYEAARLCDERALAAERRAQTAKSNKEREAAEAEARDYRQRVIDLPDPDDEIVRYLPSRSPEGEESGVSQRKAEALCRRMVAVHCLYGVDKNPLAVELAKLALWLESHAEGMPLTFLDHRLVVGDSLTGPFWDKLIMRPSKPDEPVEGIFHQGLTLALQNKLAEALSIVRHLEATVGISVAEIEEKQRLKAELDQALRPFRIIAAAWSGGVMLGTEKCDDLAYGDLLKSVAETGEIPERIDSERLRSMIGRGLEVDDSPDDRSHLYGLVSSSHCVPALPYDFAFPEVFYPNGVPHGRKGFHAVVGNPPWDAVQPSAREFFARYDLRVLAAPTKRERTSTEAALLQNPEIASSYDSYVASSETVKRAIEALYDHVNRTADGQPSAAVVDDWQLFAERGTMLLRQQGYLGWVLPSSFHSNASAGGLRQLYVMRHLLLAYYSFENKKELFEIHAQSKFSCIVARNAAGSPVSFPCAFFLHEDEYLFGDKTDALHFDSSFLHQTGGDDLTFLELRCPKDVPVVETCYRSSGLWRRTTGELHLGFGVGLDMTKQSHLFHDASEELRAADPDDRSSLVKSALDLGFLILHEGKTFHQYTDAWADSPIRYVLSVSGDDTPGSRHLDAARFLRMALREVTNSENERTAIAAIFGPSLFANTTVVEKHPHEATNLARLIICAVANSFPFDWCARLKVTRHLNKFILNSLPIPDTRTCRPLLAHAALRLTCNHSGYEPLWREQVGDAWREEGKEPFAWPVLAGDDERWEVRAAIDAVVADAYGLNRDQYEHVLSTFSHASYPKAPQLCLAKFDELQHLGLSR